MNDPPSPATAGQSWLVEAHRILEHIEHSQVESIVEVSRWCADAIAADGLVHMFGSGHSRVPLEEMFPRYGSFSGFHPMAELSMTFHTEVVGSNGQRQAMFIEKVEGLAEVILSNFTLGSSDVMVVFSASGRSAVPIEMAIGAQQRGLKVAAVTSVRESLAAPAAHSTGTRLLDHADVVIDIGTPPGDALVSIVGLETPVGPGSTLANVAVVNEIKVRVAQLLVERGIRPTVLTSPSLVGAEESVRLFDQAYADYARRLAMVLR